MDGHQKAELTLEVIQAEHDRLKMLLLLLKNVYPGLLQTMAQENDVTVSSEMYGALALAQEKLREFEKLDMGGPKEASEDSG